MTVSRSSSQPSPNVRVPRYLRRYTICAAAQHRPTSPLANSFVPDEYHYFQQATDLSSSYAHHSHWDRRRSEPFIVNPGPKVHQYRYTTIPSPSPSSVFAPILSPTAVLSRAQSLSADISPLTQHTHDLRPPSSNIFTHSQPSVSSFSSECSFHTAVDDTEFIKPSDNSPIEEPRPRSWDELPLSIKPEWSDSSNSGSRSSAFGFTSRQTQSSADTVVSPPDASGGINNPEKEGKPEFDDDDEWPVTYLTTVTRQELDEYEKENKTQQRPRKFTWRRKFTDKGTESTSASESDMAAEGRRRISRKLKKKKRPESVQTEEEGVHSLDRSHIIPIYAEGEHEEFDPLRDLPTQGLMAEAIPLELDEEAQIGIAISSDDIEVGHPLDEAFLTDEWEDMESADHHRCRWGQERLSSEDVRDLWLDDTISERIRSRTPQEILQGLDVVHEEEEEDSVSELKAEDGTPGDLAKRGSYPYIKNEGKKRHDGEPHGETIDEQDLLVDVTQQAELGTPTAPVEDVTQPTTEKPTPSSGPRRRKLSKRRRSRRNLNTDSLSPPPLPDRSTTGKGGAKRDTARRPTSKRPPSTPTLRPRRTTPQTVMSTLRLHVFRPFALLLGIDVTHGRRRLSRELRTPNALLAGRHFSEKHIPRFPSRLDGLRTVDKKVVRYD